MPLQREGSHPDTHRFSQLQTSARGTSLAPTVKPLFLSLALLACALAAPLPSRAAEKSRLTAKAVAAADAFLGTLNDSQKSAAVFAFDNETQRKNWSNLPTPLYKRAGLRLGNLDARQRAAALAVLQAVLSPDGYTKVIQIIESDEVLNQQGAPANIIFGRDEFFISFVGSPSATKPWTLQFGGHHLAINATIVGNHGTLTPSHTAAQPATFTLNGKTVRPLGGEYDKALALVTSLDAAQRSKAIIGAAFRDLVMGPGKDNVQIVPEGIKGSDLKPAQQEKLLAVAAEWVGIIGKEAADAKMTELRANLAETWFAWSGPTTAGSPAYFRIQGPTVLIEFAPQNLGGVPMNHIHTMYRDPSNEYGRKWWNP